MTEADLHLLLPELILVVSGMALLMFGVIRGDGIRIAPRGVA